MTKKLVLAMFLLFIAAGLRADTVDLTFMNVGPGNNDGPFYVYPYNFSIDGSSSLTSLICDDFNDEIFVGESWTANVYTIGDILAGAGQMNPSNGLVPSDQRDQAYEDAAWLFQQLAADPTGANAVSINDTIWALFSNTPFNSDPDVTNWFSQASSATSNLTTASAESLLGNVDFYTPVGGIQVPSSDGRPQEFIGLDSPPSPVPEPASLVLMGTALLGLAGTMRRRFHKLHKRALTPDYLSTTIQDNVQKGEFPEDTNRIVSA